MLDTELVTMTNAFLGHANLSSETSCSGLETLKTKTYFG